MQKSWIDEILSFSHICIFIFRFRQLYFWNYVCLHSQSVNYIAPFVLYFFVFLQIIINDLYNSISNVWCTGNPNTISNPFVNVSVSSIVVPLSPHTQVIIGNQQYWLKVFCFVPATWVLLSSYAKVNRINRHVWCKPRRPFRGSRWES